VCTGEGSWLGLDRRDGERGNHPEATTFPPWLEVTMWTFHACNVDTLLFAQVGQFLRWDVCLPIGLLFSVLVLGFWVVARIRRWRAELAEEESAAAEELSLDHFQKLVEDGLLDPQEYERIKARLDAAPSDMQPKNDKTNPSDNQPPDTSFRPE